MARDAKTSAVVIGLNINGLAVARALGRHGVPVTVAALDARVHEAHSRYIRDVWPCANFCGDLVRVLLDRRAAFTEAPVLIPVTDQAVRTLAANKTDLEQAYRFAMPTPDLVDALLDKAAFAALAGKLGQPTPQTFMVERPEEMPAVARQVRYPCILKPRAKSPTYSQAGGKKAYVLDSAQDLRNTYDRVAPAAEGGMVIQEYIPGSDELVHFCLQYYSRDSRALASFCGRKIRQWPPHCGGTACCQPLAIDELVHRSTAFFQAIGFHGLCSMEFKLDPRDGGFRLIEPTVCRTDWQSGVADLNGVPIAYVAYCDLTGRPLPRLRSKRHRVRWVNFAGDRKSAAYYRQRGLLSLGGWLASLRPPVRGAYLAGDDPMPWLSIMGEKFIRRLLPGRWSDAS
ncbi:MAG: hypothetical protein ABFD92_17260 [Planctomycetaceae bacterium]|nr:hypothetical protein [Planctomycetaceae bacterium]